MKKILFIEDESALQKTFGEILGQEGYEMISALDGEIGLRLAKEKKPDLILLDLILPDINGIEILKKAKKDENLKDIPFFVLTNYTNLELEKESWKLGIERYIVKANYTPLELVKMIKERLKL